MVDMDMGVAIHQILIVVACILYVMAMIRNAKWTDDPARYNSSLAADVVLKVLLNKKPPRTAYLVYVPRVALVIAIVFLFLNLWHFFSFQGETALDIKNILWRVGHIFTAFLLLCLGTDTEV